MQQIAAASGKTPVKAVKLLQLHDVTNQKPLTNAALRRRMRIARAPVAIASRTRSVMPLRPSH